MNYEDYANWWFDQYIRYFLTCYYWPNFVLGSQDEWVKLGITLNGAKPICKS